MWDEGRGQGIEDCTAVDVDLYNIFTDEEVKFWKRGNAVFKKLYFMIIVKKGFFVGTKYPQNWSEKIWG